MKGIGKQLLTSIEKVRNKFFNINSSFSSLIFFSFFLQQGSSEKGKAIIETVKSRIVRKITTVSFVSLTYLRQLSDDIIFVDGFRKITFTDY